MKKWLKRALIVLGLLLLLLLIAGVVIWTYLRCQFLDFEDESAENREFKEITVDGYTFKDRNANGQLDIYEDARRPVEARGQLGDVHVAVVVAVVGGGEGGL